MAQGTLLVTLAFWFLHSVDRLLGWQTCTRPIVAAPLVGLVLGDLQTGIIMGAALEAIFMGISPIGGTIPAEPLSSTVIAVSFTILTGADVEMGLAIALPIGTLMASFHNMINPILASFAPWWENLAYKGDMKKFRMMVMVFAVFVDRAAHIVVMFFAVGFGVEGLQGLLDVLPPWVMNGLMAAGAMMAGIGFAILVSMLWAKEIGIFLLVGFVLHRFVGLGPVPIAILAAAIAIAYYNTDKKMVELRNKKAEVTADKNNNEEDFF